MPRRILQTALAGLLVVAGVDLAGFKLGAWRQTPVLLAVLMGAAGLLGVAEAALTARDLARGPSRLARAGKLAALLGLLAMAGGGLVSWLSAIRGFVVLLEGEKISLAGGRNLRGLEAGVLAPTRDLDATLGLLSLELQRTPAGFYPEAAVGVMRPGREAERLAVLQGMPGKLGALNVFVGAFGFAPRLVVLKGDETLLDETVLFTTRREGARGVSFEGGRDLGATGVRVTGAVMLESETSVVRGHPSLSLSLRRGEEELGGGEVQLGHFATAKDGYRVGIAGMKKWAELDLSGRSHPLAARAGLVLCFAGLALWVAGARKGRGEPP